MKVEEEAEGWKEIGIFFLVLSIYFISNLNNHRRILTINYD